MPCVTGRFDPAVGVLLNVGVHRPGTVQPTTVQQTPIPPFFPALADTGASMTCISPAVARAVGATPFGMRTIGSATQHAVAANTYLVDLGIMFAGLFWFPAIQVLEFTPPSSGPYQLLLGRDILCQGILSVSLDGHFSFSI